MTAGSTGIAMDDPATIAEIPVPRRLRQVVLAILVTVIVSFFVVLSVYNLVMWHDCITVVPSILWLLFVALSLWKEKEEAHGIGQLLTNLLGAFSLRQFVRSIQIGEQPAEIQFGFRMFWCRFFYLRVAVDKIESVEWSKGQASSMVGYDMNDWNVLVWRDHGDPATSRLRQRCPKPDQEVYLVGFPVGDREVAEAFGRPLVEFLQHAGAKLLPGEDDNTFCRSW